MIDELREQAGRIGGQGGDALRLGDRLSGLGGFRAAAFLRTLRRLRGAVVLGRGAGRGEGEQRQG
ncbi:hypothetical protein [Corynebacterium urealyticum]|uniref:hypothetical protein n=1 Tax=Corynebacterium urealyticum TaxID=43771 RepID=UPI0011D1C0E0|nr:hypothetical protein [Corynebacterium urealyticum]QQC41818.1 hypothetical protein I6H51_09065 [Corynebacterium urealyticum]